MAASREDWERVGPLLAERRVQISPRYANRRAFADETGVNWRTLHDAEYGKRATFGRATVRAFESAYRLVPGSLERTLAGGPLEPAEAQALPPRPDIMHPALAPEEEEFLSSILPMLRDEDQEVVKGILRLLDGEGRPWAWERKRDLILAYAGMVTEQRRQAAGLQILRV